MPCTCRSLEFHFCPTSGSLGPYRWSYEVSHNSIFQKKKKKWISQNLRMDGHTKKVTSKYPFRLFARDLKIGRMSDKTLSNLGCSFSTFLCRNSQIMFTSQSDLSHFSNFLCPRNALCWCWSPTNGLYQHQKCRRSFNRIVNNLYWLHWWPIWE